MLKKAIFFVIVPNYLVYNNSVLKVGIKKAVIQF